MPDTIPPPERLHWLRPRTGVWRPLYRVAIWLLGAVCPRRYGFTVTGRERLPARGGVIVVVNHLADVDPPFVCLACAPRDAVTLGASRHFTGRPLGYLLSALGTVPLRMGTADMRALRYASEHLGRGGLLVVYPEGAPTFGPTLAPFTEGVGLLAQTPGTTVVPAAIWGSHRVVRGRLPLGRGPVRVAFGPPIEVPSDGPRRERARVVTERCRAAVGALLGALVEDRP